MKVIIAGPRNFTDYSNLLKAIEESGFIITEVFHGACRGVDQLGERWGKEQRIPTRAFPPNWEMGKKAGPMRNMQMALQAEALLAIWDGVSKGTDNMIKTATCLGLKVYVHRIDK